MGMKCVGCNTPIPLGAGKCPVCWAPSDTFVTEVQITQEPETKPSPRIIPSKHSEKKCTSCLMTMPKSASKCPYCRTKQGITLGKIIAAVFIFGIFTSILSGINSGSKPPTAIEPSHQPTAQEIEEAQRSDAKYMAKEFVTERLKAPSTAKFPYYGDFAASKTPGGSWQVMGYVDAQNSYGAMLRQQFLCTLKKTGDKWFLTDLKMPY